MRRHPQYRHGRDHHARGGRGQPGRLHRRCAPEIDAAQYETGVGPCLDAFRHQQVYRVDDMRADRVSPAFSRSAASHGIASSMSLPLVVHHEGIGALNLYSHVTKAYSDSDVEVGLQLAAHAAIVLANSQAYEDAQQLGFDMAKAMKSRASIEQAKGMLMSAQHCSADDAFQMLVRASQRENRKLREIADDIVARTVDGATQSTTEMLERGISGAGRHIPAR